MREATLRDARSVNPARRAPRADVGIAVCDDGHARAARGVAGFAPNKTPAGGHTVKSVVAALALAAACAGPALALDAPAGIAVDSAGNVYVTNAGASGYVAVYNALMQPVHTLGGLASPTSVAVDSQGRVFVGDLTQNTVFVYAPGQTVPGQAITQYVAQPIHVRIGAYGPVREQSNRAAII
jgi:DNA-binding beta-propeller fold protein YncE